MTDELFRARRGWLLALTVGLIACHDSDTLHDYFHHATLHEAYQASLEQSGLLDAGLGRDWVRAATTVLDSATAISLPYRESGYLPADSAVALAYQFSGRRGEAYAVTLETSGRRQFAVFVDLFHAPRDSLDDPRHVASVDSMTPGLSGVFNRDGEYLLRLQPELLRGGRYTLTIEVGPSLAFPVEGMDSRAILSAFGAARDGGRRQHHGVDIFAQRGTPVLAAADGRVTGVREGGLGGKVVWQLDRERGEYLYYAHLDSQAVVRGQTIERGDTLGFVGNSGNARTTPPHLHFGIYRRGQGPIDPWPFVHLSSATAEPVVADTSVLGRWVRTREATTVRQTARANGTIVFQAARHTLMRATAATGEWYQVALPDGRIGFLTSTRVELADQSVGQRQLAAGERLYDYPQGQPTVVASSLGETVASVYGMYGEYQLVRAPGMRAGWVGAPEDEPLGR